MKAVDVQQRLGRRIRDARKRQILTQEELAERCGLTPKSISEIERGHVNVPLQTLWTIAKELDVTLSELTFGIDVAVPREVRTLEGLFAGRTRDELLALVKVLSAMQGLTKR